MAAPPQAEALVLMLNGALTGEEFGTVALANEKHPLVNAGLLETTQEIEPVYPC